MTTKQKLLAWWKSNRGVVIGCLVGTVMIAVALFLSWRNEQKTSTVPLEPAAIEVDTNAAQSLTTAPIDQTGLTPCLYKMFDYGTDFQKSNPEWGAVGSVQYYMWDEMNPSEGVYNWNSLNANLALERALTVTLASGVVISKPVVIEVVIHISEHANWKATFYDATPTWVYDQMDAANPNARCPIINGRKVGHALSGCGAIAVLPAYENTIWQAKYYKFVQALGARLANESEVVAVVVSTGLDTETQPIKPWGCDWYTIMNEQASGVEYRFFQSIPATMAVYKSAFGGKTLLINNAPGSAGTRKTTSEAAVALGIGIKNSSLWTDRDSASAGGSAFPGLWDPLATYSNTVRMGESVYGMGSAADRLWTFYAALHFHLDALDVHPEYLTQSKPEWLQFTQRHLGVTLDSTEDIWTVFRKQEYPKQEWVSNGITNWVSGWPTDWQFWLYRTSTNTIINQADLALYPEIKNNPYSRQVLKLEPGESVTLQMADGWREGPYTIEVIAAGDGTLTLGNYTRGASTSSWQTLSYTLMSGHTLTLTAREGVVFLHMVTVKPFRLDPTPLATPTYTATATATRISTPTATMTRTPLPTSTNIPTALPTFTHTPVPTKTPGCRCTCECICTCE